ncbi:MAG: hypothetical protein NWF10_05810 [Candidatus Bathyarchaeota archaeon]|nr:hypothetical protein [Candidatus Bathyarchaeota archaeon]
MQAITRLLRNNKRGISTVIIVMLSLVLIVTIVGNVILWSYQMNQVDWEKMQEKIEIISVQSVNETWTKITFQNGGSLTSHIVSLWINNSTNHQRFEIDTFIAPGEITSKLYENINLPNGSYTTKISTERGNVAILPIE